MWFCFSLNGRFFLPKLYKFKQGQCIKNIFSKKRKSAARKQHFSLKNNLQ